MKLPTKAFKSVLRRFMPLSSPTAIKGHLAIPEAPSALSIFLRTTKQAYLGDIRDGKDKIRSWTVVMGNEAGDLDSIASSVAYAYVQSTAHNKPTVPLIRFDSADLALRAENTHALSLAGVLDPKQDLLFTDDLPQILPSHTFALVDHNRLASQYESKDAVVTAIIDHHADEGFHADANPRIVAPAGSCSSHITALIASTTAVQILPEVATLLLCAILIDTNGLKEGGKAIDVDRASAAWIVPRSTLVDPSQPPNSLVPSSPEVKELSSILKTKKDDVSHLSSWSLLRRDYKEYDIGGVRAGLSSVPVRLSVLDTWTVPNETGASPGLRDEAARYMVSRDLLVLGVLTSFRDEEKGGKKAKGQREMAWFVRGADADALAADLWAGLERSKELDVSLKKKFTDKFNTSGGIRARVYEQNPDATRKTTAPVLRAILEGRVSNDTS